MNNDNFEFPKVANYTYECFHPGQEINIRINFGGWLHRGAIICPPCKEICGNEFEQRGEKCKFNDEAPPSNKYPKDELRCGSSTSKPPNLVLFVIISLIFAKHST